MTHRHDRGKRTLPPPWLLGMIIAAVIFAGFVFAFHVLGFGDVPTLE